MSQADRASDNGPPKYKRSAKNYLIDTNFQLKYTGFLVAIAIVLSLGLGLLLWQSGSQVIAQSRRTVAEGAETVKQGQITIERGQEVIRQSKKVSQVVSMYIEKEYGDNVDLLKTFREEAEKDESTLNEEQRRLEADAVFLTKRAQELEQQSADMLAQQQRMFFGLVLALALLVIGIGVAGIVFTHKIAGPIFKMKRLLRGIGEGKLVLRERLRKGDELQHFFETFEQMVENLREKQREEIAQVDTILVTLASEGSKEGAELLTKLREEMQDHLEP
jgi:hypothetical protein